MSQGKKTSRKAIHHCLNNQNLPGRTYCQLENYFREKWKVFALASSLLTFQKANQHVSNAKTQSALSNSKTRMKVPTAKHMDQLKPRPKDGRFETLRSLPPNNLRIIHSLAPARLQVLLCQN